jgi:hypothetical protein
VAQFPNLALGIFLATLALRPVVAGSARARPAVGAIGSLALGWWAADEIARGVNPWRRALGLGVGISLVLSLVR